MSARTRKSASGVAVVVAVLLAVTACSSGGTKAPAANSGSGATKSGAITIAYLQKQGDQQYFIDEATGAKAEAAKLGNVNIVTANLGTDSNLAISDLQTEIGQKVDGIAIVVPDQKIGPQVIQAVGSIPMVASDDPISERFRRPRPVRRFRLSPNGHQGRHQGR